MQKHDYSYGDLRMDQRVKSFYKNIVEKNSVCIRSIAGCRKQEVAFHRLIKNPKFSTTKMIADSRSHSQKVTKNSEHILCIQDTTELYFDEDYRRVRKGLGSLTNSFCKGIFLHPGLLVNADDYSVLGLSDVIYWTRYNNGEKTTKDEKYKKLPIEEKESYRWLQLAQNTKKYFSHVKQITIIADRESDIYEEWDRIPDTQVHLLTRISRNRVLNNKEYLFEMLDKLAASFSYKINLGGITGKRKKRIAELSVAYKSIEISRPKNGRSEYSNKSIKLNAIIVKEISRHISSKEKILWRLLTTHEVNTIQDARKIINWYTKRWMIEQLFRTLKTQGINVESSQVEDGVSLTKIAISGIISAVKIMQLVQARDGLNNRKMNDVFHKDDFKILEGLNKNLEGKTTKQKNHHVVKSLAWCSWIIARLGGWMGYACERPPGPITMKRGLDYFYKIKVGWLL